MNDTSNTVTTRQLNSILSGIQRTLGVGVWWIRCLGLAGLGLNVILFLALVLSSSCSTSSDESLWDPTESCLVSQYGNFVERSTVPAEWWDAVNANCLITQNWRNKCSSRGEILWCRCRPFSTVIRCGKR